MYPGLKMKENCVTWHNTLRELYKNNLININLIYNINIINY